MNNRISLKLSFHMLTLFSVLLLGSILVWSPAPQSRHPFYRGNTDVWRLVCTPELGIL